MPIPHWFNQGSLVLASNNKGKVAEFEHLFQQLNLPVEIIPQGKLNIEDAIEDGLSFVENAIIKARHAARISGKPAIADDSGLCVPILGGAPGIYSARYAGEHGNDAANNQKLLADLVPFRKEGEAIEGLFVCVLALPSSRSRSASSAQVVPLRSSPSSSVRPCSRSRTSNISQPDQTSAAARSSPVRSRFSSSSSEAAPPRSISSVFQTAGPRGRKDVRTAYPPSGRASAVTSKHPFSPGSLMCSPCVQPG